MSARAAGILLHPTSLPGPHAIGDLGAAAHEFVDFLAEAGATRWQILPLGPPGYGGSPYDAESSFAGNELLIALQPLVADGFLDATDVPAAIEEEHTVDLALARELRDEPLRTAFENARVRASADIAAFRVECAAWIEDWALYRALKSHHDRAHWHEWPAPLRRRDPVALEQARADLADEVDYAVFLQWVFDRQWNAVRDRAAAAGIQVIGDIPMFPSLDSADVWSAQHLFKLDEDGFPAVVAGVPPDYFSATGQLWGNPHYDWDAHAREGYAWWAARFEWTFRRVDTVRIDHFRGFESAWEIPAGSEDATSGEWVPGPGLSIFERLGLLGRGAIIAEDLGIITDDVRELLQATDFPGMKVLQFAFDGGSTNDYLPHNHVHNAVAYTGTHDNDTTQGWLDALTPAQRRHVADYLGHPSGPLLDALVRACYASVADTAVIPMQDVLGLGTEARMNTPSERAGNWAWRFSWDQLPAGRAGRLARITELYGRAPGEPEPAEPDPGVATGG